MPQSRPFLALRKMLTGLLLILLGIVLAVIIFELALSVLPFPNRFALNQQLADQWESDDELLLHLKPNLDLHITAHPEFQYVVRTNADGLRDEPFDGDFDIATIGDSFTFGFGVDAQEAWPTRLEAISQQRVANLGWAGWSSHIYPKTIERHAVGLNAHTWIWTFFINDLTESTGAADFIESGQTDFKAQAYRQPPFPFNLRTFGAVMALVNPEYRLLADSGDTVFENGELQMLLSHYAWQHTDPDNPDVQRGWELTAQALQEGAALAAEHDANLLLVFIPPREHVYWPLIQEAMPDVDVQQLDDVAARLESMAEAEGIAFLNLLPGFRAPALEGQMLYFPADGHWNAAGHALAAQLIHDRLIQESLLPE